MNYQHKTMTIVLDYVNYSVTGTTLVHSRTVRSSERSWQVAVDAFADMPVVGRVWGRSSRKRSVFVEPGQDLPSAGIRQFADLGSGIPTVGNVHSIAQEHDLGVRVVYEQ